MPLYLGQAFLHAKQGTYGKSMTLTLGPEPTSPWVMLFDNTLLNRSVGFIRSGGWRAAVRRVADSERNLNQDSSKTSARLVEFRGSDLSAALRFCGQMLLDLGYTE